MHGLNCVHGTVVLKYRRQVIDDFMKHLVATLLCLAHILTFTICTYIAAHEIRTILVSAWICSLTGIVAGLAALVSLNVWLSLVSFLTPMVAVALFLLEILILNLGPRRAALPFCITFIVVQLITNLVSFCTFKFGDGRKKTINQISIRTMLVATVAISIFFAIARLLFRWEHDTIMLVALALTGLTFVGVVLTVVRLISWRTAGDSEVVKTDDSQPNA